MDSDSPVIFAHSNLINRGTPIEKGLALAGGVKKGRPFRDGLHHVNQS